MSHIFFWFWLKKYIFFSPTLFLALDLTDNFFVFWVHIVFSIEAFYLLSTSWAVTWYPLSNGCRQCLYFLIKFSSWEGFNIHLLLKFNAEAGVQRYLDIRAPKLSKFDVSQFEVCIFFFLYLFQCQSWRWHVFFNIVHVLKWSNPFWGLELSKFINHLFILSTYLSPYYSFTCRASLLEDNIYVYINIH